MARGGKRSGAGRRKNEAEQAGAPNKALAGEILDGLALSDAEWKAKGHPDQEKTDQRGQKLPCGCEKCMWRRDCQEPGANGQGARRYLWDRRDGKSVQHSVVNHLHDKPIELTGNLTVSLAETIQKARKRVCG